MIDLHVSCVEDAVIRFCEAKEPVSRILVDSSSSAFLAYNTVHGYSQIDFRRPDSARLRELAAVLDLHVDLQRTSGLYTSLYLDMIWTVDPAVDVVFQKDGVTAHGNARAGGQRPTAAPGRPGRAPGPTTLIAFGDSYVYGSEISEVELGRNDPGYRAARCYPALLARELGIALGANLAEPGRSNNKIFRRVVDFVREQRQDLGRYFLVIGITHPARKGFFLKDGQEYWFAGPGNAPRPQVIQSLCLELFYPPDCDMRMNHEIEHKYWVLSCFLRRLGCRFVVVPAWNFARSHEFFRERELGHEAAFFGEGGKDFGVNDVVQHLPRGPHGHPLSEGHTLFSRELAKVVRARWLV